MPRLLVDKVHEVVEDVLVVGELVVLEPSVEPLLVLGDELLPVGKTALVASHCCRCR